jgi:hypothetical protein
MRRHQSKDITINAKNKGNVCVTEPGSILGDRVQHRLEVGRRIADNTQELIGGGLLLQRLREIPGPLLNLLL